MRPKSFTLSVCTASLFALVLVAVPCVLPAQNYNFNSGGGEPEPLIAAPPMPAPQPMQAAPQATDLQIRMNALETLVRNMTGQMEKLQFQNTQLQQSLQRMGGDLDVRFRDLETKQAAQENAMKAIALQQQQQAQTPPAAAPQPTPTPAAEAPKPEAPKETPKEEEVKEEAGAVNKPAPTSGGNLGTIKKDGDGKPEKDSAEAQAQYDAAFQSLRQAKYDEAEGAFKAFLESYPKHRLTENAKYWLSETYYVRGKFPEAAVAFAEGYEQFPKGGKAPDNLLKLSMSLGAIGKKEDACLTIAELLKRFPQAAAVTRNRAEQQKKALGCGKS